MSCPSRATAKAGLVTEKQSKKAERQTSQQQHQRKRQPARPRRPEQQAAARKAQAAVCTRPAAQSRTAGEGGGQARRAELRQFIDQHRVPRVASDDYYNSSTSTASGGSP